MAKNKGKAEKKEETTNALSTQGQFSQKDIPNLLEKVNEQIKALKGSAEQSVKTDVNIPSFGKIKDIKKLDELIKLHSWIQSKEEDYKNSVKNTFTAEKFSGIKPPAFSLYGVSASSLYADIEFQYKLIAHKSQLDKLQKVKATLEENLSQEAKLANDLAKIANILND